MVSPSLRLVLIPHHLSPSSNPLNKGGGESKLMCMCIYYTPTLAWQLGDDKFLILYVALWRCQLYSMQLAYYYRILQCIIWVIPTMLNTVYMYPGVRTWIMYDTGVKRDRLYWTTCMYCCNNLMYALILFPQSVVIKAAVPNSPTPSCLMTPFYGMCCMRDSWIW